MDDLFEPVEMDTASFIRARDPSIQAAHIPRKPVNLQSRFNEVLREELEEETEHLEVFLRIKNAEDIQELYEIIDNETLLCKIPDDAACIKNIRYGHKITKKFTFSKIFPPNSQQIDLFNGVVKEKVLNFINGRNCSLLTYGASGSGKTFTILGTNEEPGIIPRALEYLFHTLPFLSDQTTLKPVHPGAMVRLNQSTSKIEREACHQIINSLADRKLHMETYKAMQKRLTDESGALIDDLEDVHLGIWVTFSEIYNEHIYDLLVPQPPKGKPRQKLQLGNINGNVYIKNLKPIHVTSGMEAFLILQYGRQNLQYAETQLNSHSSRSHCIFTIKLVQTSEKRSGTTVSHFHFCDLAGSERVKKTMNIGDRLKESNNINQSLLVLGKCISSVRNKQKHTSDNRVVPFRESKLTQLFHKALAGQESIALIVNINPSRNMFDESQHVLNFSAIAKDIVIEKSIVRNEKRNSLFSQYMESRNTCYAPDVETRDYDYTIEQLRSEIYQLRAELELKEEEVHNERRRVISGYKEILMIRDNTHKNQIEFIKAQAANKEKMLKEEIEKLQQQLNGNDIIDLTSDDEDKSEYLEKELHESKEKLKEKDIQLECLTSQLTSEEEKVKELEEKVKELKDENNQYKLILNDAQRDTNDLRTQISELEKKSSEQTLQIIQLQEENAELLAELQNNIEDQEIDMQNLF